MLLISQCQYKFAKYLQRRRAYIRLAGAAANLLLHIFFARDAQRLLGTISHWQLKVLLTLDPHVLPDYATAYAGRDELLLKAAILKCPALMWRRDITYSTSHSDGRIGLIILLDSPCCHDGSIPLLFRACLSLIE